MKVYMGQGAHAYKEMFRQRGWGVVDTLEEADLIQFVGGADVSPTLYGEDFHPQTHANKTVDDIDIALFEAGRRMGMPMAGICRGGQFLHVMNGGLLWQHVDGHAIAQGHSARCLATGERLMVTSTHHQMMRNNCGELLMEAVVTTNTFAEHMVGGEVVTHNRTYEEVEAVFHHETKCLCFQPHPEMCRVNSPCQNKYFEYLEGLLCLK